MLRLEHNYRSEPRIVAAANRLVAGRPGRSPSPRAAAAAPDATGVARFATDADEARAVAGEVRALVAGVPAESIAVLYRVNGQGAPIEAALGDEGVAAATKGTLRSSTSRWCGRR